MAAVPKNRFGLIGRNIDYSFSRSYFGNKFKSEKFQENSYENFHLETIAEFPEILIKYPDLKGLNVTTPYKEAIIPYLDELSKNAQAIGAVNVIRFKKNGKLKGYNSDWYGFKAAVYPLLEPHHTKALLIGSGGAAKAVAYGLNQLGIASTFISRENRIDRLNYTQIDAAIFAEYPIVINCTPLGTYPNIEAYPPLPYQLFTAKHIAFDLIYNPEKTVFLEKAAAQNAVIKNGYSMLVAQAEKAWEIWNK